MRIMAAKLCMHEEGDDLFVSEPRGKRVVQILTCHVAFKNTGNDIASTKLDIDDFSATTANGVVFNCVWQPRASCV